MKIALVQPPGWTVDTPPLGIAYLSAYLKNKSYDVACYDFNIEAYHKKTHRWLWNIPRLQWAPETVDIVSYFKREIKTWANKLLDDDSSIIGFSVTTFSRPICSEVAKRIKMEDKTKVIVFGGPICMRGSHLSSFFQDGVDIIVLGEGEETLYEIVKMLEKKNKIVFSPGTIFKYKGNIIDCGDNPPIKNLDKIPFPDFSDFPRKKYLIPEAIPILANRGCIGSCAFCSDHLFWKKHRSRSAKNVFEEMKLRFDSGYTEFHFCDLTLNSNLKLLNELCDLIIHSKLYRRITLGGEFRSRPEMNFGFFKKLKETGLGRVNIGIESGSQKILNQMNKGYKVKVIEKNLRDMHRAGIGVSINLLVGFPGETLKTINETIQFLHHNRKYIYEIVSIGEVGLRFGSPIASNPQKYGIVRNNVISFKEIEEPKIEGNWQTLDGKNTPTWRREQSHRIFMAAFSLGINTGFSEIDSYYIPFIENCMQTRDFDKMYKTIIEGLKHTNEVIYNLRSELDKRKELKERWEKMKKMHEIASLQIEKMEVQIEKMKKMHEKSLRKLEEKMKKIHGKSLRKLEEKWKKIHGKSLKYIDQLENELEDIHDSISYRLAKSVTRTKVGNTFKKFLKKVS